MYLSFYGLNEKPFDISTDPKFLWLGDKHKEAFAILKYGVIDNKGFLLLTGDVGAGKTTLINALVNCVSEDVIIAFIPDPGLELMEFYRYLAHEFKFDNSFSNKADFIFIFREFLHNAHANGKRVLLIIDEAQRLTNSLLEEIRLLSNIELQNSKLLNIFFVGQAEFNTKLLESENRAVRQRITISNHIHPLTEKETGDYIRHRLKVAGSQKNIFSYVAIHEVYKFSGGYPRLINIVCDIALLTGYVRESKKISDDIVLESIESLNIDYPGQTRNGDDKNQSTPVLSAQEARKTEVQIYMDDHPGKRRIWPVITVIILLCIIVAGIVHYLNPSFFNNQIKLINIPELKFKLHDTKDLPPHGSTEKKKDLKDRKVENKQLPPVEGYTPGNADKPSDNLLSTLKDNKIILDFGYNTNEFLKSDYQLLSKLAEFMKTNQDVYVNINGYTDDKGGYTYNVNLSEFRANNVKSYLLGQGIDMDRLKVKGYGSEKPRATNATEDGRRLNRRVEIEIIRGLRK